MFIINNFIVKYFVNVSIILYSEEVKNIRRMRYTIYYIRYTIYKTKRMLYNNECVNLLLKNRKKFIPYFGISVTIVIIYDLSTY